MTGFEILEHTADVGIRATGDTLEQVFEQATLGLVDIAGIAVDDSGEPILIDLEAGDAGALLVDWLSEVLWLHDSRDSLVASVEIESVSDGRVRGQVALSPRGERNPEGTQVKAITYHRLRVEETPGGWLAEVYVDV
ncbi:MAG: archease [Haloechinothrix sp.]